MIVFVISNYNPAHIFAQYSGTTTLITYGTRQLQWDGGTDHRMTPDGRYIVFLSGYYNGPEKTQVFLYDRVLDTTELVSVNANGDVANWNIYDVDISNDGQIIAYSTYAYNLDTPDTNSVRDIYVYNRLTGQTTRASVGVNGAQFDGSNFLYTISDDGYRVAFSTQDLNSLSDVYIRVIPNELLDTPTLIAPADMALVNPPVEFSWNAVNGATDYRIQIATDNQFVNITLDKELTTTTYSLNGLTSGTYYWRVRTVVNEVFYGEWSAVGIGMRLITSVQAPSATLWGGG